MKNSEPQPQALMPLPRGVTIRRESTDLVITRRWYSETYFIVLVFGIFWNGTLALVFKMLLGEGAPWPVLALPLLHVVIGIYLVYIVVTGLLNSTEIRISPTAISVRHYPLPWTGNMAIPSADIAQLCCEEITRQGWNRYGIGVLRKDKRRLMLLKWLDSYHQAHFIEQQIEAFLGIADRRVPGEVNA